MNIHKSVEETFKHLNRWERFRLITNRKVSPGAFNEQKAFEELKIFRQAHLYEKHDHHVYLAYLYRKMKLCGGKTKERMQFEQKSGTMGPKFKRDARGEIVQCGTI